MNPQPAISVEPIAGTAHWTSTVDGVPSRAMSYDFCASGWGRAADPLTDLVAVLQAGGRRVDRIDEDTLGRPRILVPGDTRTVRGGVVTHPDEHDGGRERRAEQQPERRAPNAARPDHAHPHIGPVGSGAQVYGRTQGACEPKNRFVEAAGVALGGRFRDGDRRTGRHRGIAAASSVPGVSLLTWM